MKRCGARLLALAVLALLASGSASSPEPSVAIAYPENHAVRFVDPLTGTAEPIVVELKIHNFRVPDDGVIHITGEKIGDHSNYGVHADARPFVHMSGIELGTHFWTFTLAYHNGSRVHGVATNATIHMEVVVQQDTALPQWHYTLSQRERRPRILFNPPPVTRSSGRTHRMCIIGKSSGLFDGQKKIWLQTIAALSANNWTIHFMTFEPVEESSLFVTRLRELNVSVTGAPVEVRQEDLDRHGLSASEAMPTAIQSFQNEFQSEDVTMRSFQERIGNLQPPFLAGVWRHIVGMLHKTCAGAVLVMGNSRYASDTLLTMAARIAGTRAVVVEMTNLRPVALQVDAVVAPSHFALHHPSVTSVVNARQRYALIMGVNSTLFRPRLNRYQSTFTVGYIGRLSTDKSVGLVLGVAKLLSKSCPTTCRVRIIGNGPLRSQLEGLTREWQLTQIVQFVGGVYAEDVLVSELHELDVVLSPCFHETFGIAPLEAMSCGIPVVAFATGGVLEYLEHHFNGIVVREPTPEAMYEAVVTLRDNEELRRRLGDQARRTVLDRFTLEFGRQQFVSLYERLARN